ncbi:MAG: hypothetical protein FWD80_00975 [Propionibacteriaceae bacterium]|nr:hypothetical protein [Propionibacteriaceae bacterium]
MAATPDVVGVLTAWLYAAALTVVIETALLAVAGYRSRRFVAVCVCINVATNVTLNVVLSVVSGALGFWPWGLVGVLEVVVVAVEWAVLRLVAGPGGRPVPIRARASVRLAGFVLLANLASFTVGLFLYHP